MSSSGKGQSVVRGPEHVATSWRYAQEGGRAGGGRCIVEGFVTFDEMMAMLSELGRVTVEEKDYRRYVGAQIGIHNPSGEKVGKVSHLRNREYLFVCDRS